MFKDFTPSISVEKMAAFLDANLSDDEMSSLGDKVLCDAELQYLVDECDSIDDTEILNSNMSEVTPIDLDSLILPEVGSQITNLNDTGMEKVVIGISGEDVKDPIFIEQPDNHSCALRCQQIMLRDYGIDIPFKELEKLALEHHIYSSNGTLVCDMGKVMELAGVPYHVSEGNTVNDLMRELAQGHRVMVGVDANELWYNKSEGDQLKNKMSDAMTEFFKNVFHVNGGNHALIVAGFEVDPKNPSDLKVVLTDPGDGHFRITYPARQFADAWHDSNCFMVATDKPAPYQYDYEHHQMVPSQFAIQEHLNEWVTENSFQLNPDVINVPSDHVPYYLTDSHCSTMFHNLGVTDAPALVSGHPAIASSIGVHSHPINFGSIDIDNIQEASLSQILSGGTSTLGDGGTGGEDGGDAGDVDFEDA